MDEGLHLIILDEAWRPRRAEPIARDWHAPIARLVAEDCRWIALHQSRRHPLGPGPVNDDIALTRALVRWLRPFDMRLADHIIRTHETRFSFRAAGLL